MDKKKKKTIIAIVVILLIVIDLGVMLYPKISAYVNEQSQTRAVVQYFDDVEAIGSENMKKLLNEAHDYNKALLSKTNRFNMSDDELAEYNRQLDTGRGVIGTLMVDKIDVKLPIYHGTNESVLQIGLGHMPGTSLPVGGAGTHAFITGHRGLPSSILLTDLDKMEIGDTFALYVMGETLTYQVDNIQTVEPHEAEALDIDPDMDYCTLVTCTPYGINTHRLLVRGQRIENDSNDGWDAMYMEARLLDKTKVALAVIALSIPVLIVYIIIKSRKINKGGIVQ
ncbi:MAG: class C sortase [Clostridiales bacterium]|nr:class C sortase [Clostridiales bacterium]